LHLGISSDYPKKPTINLGPKQETKFLPQFNQTKIEVLRLVESNHLKGIISMDHHHIDKTVMPKFPYLTGYYLKII